MLQPEILEALTLIARDVFDDDTLALTPATTALDVPTWDSFTHLTFIVAIEQKFNVAITLPELESLRNIGDLSTLLETKVLAQIESSSS